MKFIIVAPARSGSTLLREMLNNHPEICCHGEVYGLHRVLGHSAHGRQQLDGEIALKLRRRDPVRFLDEHVFTSECRVVGFKLLYSQMLNLDFAPVLQRLMEMPELHVIHLWRRNLIARHVSEARLRLKVASRNPGKAPESFLEDALRPTIVEQSCRINLSARACANKLFDQQPTLHLSYEDYVADHAAQSALLCEFLGVDLAGWGHLPEKAGEASNPETERLKLVPMLRPYFAHP